MDFCKRQLVCVPQPPIAISYFLPVACVFHLFQPSLIICSNTPIHFAKLACILTTAFCKNTTSALNFSKCVVCYVEVSRVQAFESVLQDSRALLSTMCEHGVREVFLKQDFIFHFYFLCFHNTAFRKARLSKVCRADF